MVTVNAFTIILASLATYRIVRLVAIEEGPYSILQTLRGMADPDQRTWLGRGLSCAWCISFWAGPAMIWLATYDIGLLLVAGLAVSSIVGLGYQCSGLLM